jgi:hypothetical protein
MTEAENGRLGADQSGGSADPSATPPAEPSATPPAEPVPDRVPEAASEPAADVSDQPVAAVSGAAAADRTEPVSANPSASPDAAPNGPVAAVMRELENLSERDLAEHPDVFQRIHGELQAALAAIDDA